MAILEVRATRGAMVHRVAERVYSTLSKWPIALATFHLNP
jgi:hypothetical protein